MSETLALLTAAWALPVSAPAIADAALVIRKNKIERVVPQEELSDFYSEDEIRHLQENKVDYGDAVLTPGLINLHTHLDISLRHDLYPKEQQSMFLWMRQLVTGFSEWSPEDWQRSAFTGAAQSALNGTSCIVDNSFTGQSAMQIAKIGLRGIVGLELFGQDETLAQSAFDRWRKKMELARQTATPELQEALACGRVQLTVSLSAPYTVAPALWSLADQWCRQNETLLLAHLAESPEEHEWIEKGNELLEDYLLFVREWQAKIGILPYKTTDAPPTPWRKKGRSPCQLLSDHGLLNERLVATHVVQVDDEDISLLADNSVRIVHCPRSNKCLSNGVSPLRKFWTAGLSVGLGTDSLASNEDLNMLKEAAAMIEIQQLPMHLGLEAITLDAAKVIGLEDKIGSLEPGKLADIAVFRFNGGKNQLAGAKGDSNLQHRLEEILIGNDPQLVDLIVDGRWVVKNQKLLAAGNSCLCWVCLVVCCNLWHI